MEDILQDIENQINSIMDLQNEIEEITQNSEKLRMEEENLKQEQASMTDRQNSFYQELTEEIAKKHEEFIAANNERMGKNKKLDKMIDEKKQEIKQKISDRKKLIEDRKQMDEELKEEKARIEKEIKLNDFPREKFDSLSDSEKKEVRQAKEKYLINKRRLSEIENQMSQSIEMLNILEGQTFKDKFMEADKWDKFIDTNFNKDGMHIILEQLGKEKEKEQEEPVVEEQSSQEQPASSQSEIEVPSDSNEEDQSKNQGIDEKINRLIKEYNYTEENVNEVLKNYEKEINDFFESKGINGPNIVKKSVYEEFSRRKDLILDGISRNTPFSLEMGVHEFGGFIAVYKDSGIVNVMNGLLWDHMLFDLGKNIETLKGDAKNEAIQEYNNLLEEAKKLGFTLFGIEPKQGEKVQQQEEQEEVEVAAEEQQQEAGTPYSWGVPQSSQWEEVEEEQEEEIPDEFKIERITCFAKNGFYHIKFADGTAIGINRVSKFDRETMKSLQIAYGNYGRKKTIDYNLMAAIDLAFDKKREYDRIFSENEIKKYKNTYIDNYIDGMKDIALWNFPEMVYDNVTTASEVKEIHEESLNSYEKITGRPGIAYKRQMRKIMKSAKNIDKLTVKGPVGRWEEIKDFISRKINLLSPNKKEYNYLGKLKETAVEPEGEQTHDNKYRATWKDGIEVPDKVKEEVEKISIKYVQNQDNDVVEPEEKEEEKGSEIEF